MFGPALLWGEPLFEGAFVAHDMMGNKTPFKEADKDKKKPPTNTPET